MERIPEPDLMDDKVQAEAYAATDFSEAHDAFVEHFKRCFPDFKSGTVLDLGCGAADVTIRFARALPDTQFTGIDGAQAMLDIGLRDVTAKGLDTRIKLQKCFIPDSDLIKDKFDAVISNNLLHHLNDPFSLWETVAHCIDTNKPIFIMDLFRADSTETAHKLVETYAKDAPDILKKDFYNSLLASYNINEIKQQLIKSKLDFLSIETVSDRHLIIWGNK